MQAIAGVNRSVVPFTAENLILGDGYFESSLLFIGTYEGAPVQAERTPYNIPLAYAGPCTDPQA